MCGIAGWINMQSDLSHHGDIVEQMSNTLSKRGPDASGIWRSQHAILGHRRLIVIDPEGGSQPMTKNYGDYSYSITYNGELYNTNELRNELIDKGHKFISHSDTEVLLVSYIEWGKECCEHLNGIYAFGVWDEKNQSLFLGRDRFGVKPLFYTNIGSSFIFASEIKALLQHPLVQSKVDAQGLSEIFSLGPARSPGIGVYKNVYEVKPAHYLVYGRDGVHINRYWSLVSKPHEDDFNTTVEKIRQLVLDCIDRQLVSDVPICTFLSGGLDSSAISAVAANHFKKNNKGQLDTFSIDYVDNDKYFKVSKFQPNADAYWIKLMSDKFNTNHHYIKFDTEDLVQSLIDALKVRDLPGMADIDSSLLLFCREIKRYATVGLSGECADEIFGGYPWFHNEEALNANTFPWSRSVNERKKVLSDELINMIKPEQYIAKRYNETLEEVPKLQGESALEARRREMFYLNITWFMTTLLDRKDRMSMGTGLEVRVPFCDHRLVEYVWNIPWDMKFYEGREKGLLRHALKDLLPEEIITRKKSPYPKTHNPAYENAVAKMLLNIINDSSSPILPLINIEAVKTMINGKSDYGKPWFGQLMATPQMYAYLIQVNNWLKDYGVSIV